MPDTRVHIIVDGIVYGLQYFGGINTYFNEVLPRLAQRDETSVTLLVPKNCKGALPEGSISRLPRETLPTKTNINRYLDRAVGPIMDRANAVVRNWRIIMRKPCVFHSTYFTWVGNSVVQVASAHDLNHELLPELYRDAWGVWLRRQYREYMQRATRIIAVSNKTKQDVVRFYGIDPSLIHVVYHAVNRNHFWPDQDRGAWERLNPHGEISRPYLLYVGERAHPYKNFSALAKAVAQLSKRTHISLVVAGKPANKKDKALLSELGITSLVHFVSRPSVDRLRALYSNALAFVFPSYHEGFGIPLIEAMACGTPVIASDIQVFREVAGDAAIWFSPSDVEDLGQAVEQAFDERVRERLVALGFNRIANYSWECAARRTHDVYLEALRDGTP